MFNLIYWLGISEKHGSYYGMFYIRTNEIFSEIFSKIFSEMFSSEFHAESVEVITDTKKIADHFNEYFVNIGSKLAEQIPSAGVPF